MPELIKDGETGFLVNSVQEMVEAVPQVERIEAERCRRHVEENFDVHHLVAAYERLYAKVLAAASYLAGDQPGSQPLTRGQTKSGGQLALVS